MPRKGRGDLELQGGAYAPASGKPPPRPASAIHSSAFRRIIRERAAWELPAAGSGEQSEVDEQAQGMPRARPGPIWILDPASGSAGWRCALAVLRSAGGAGGAGGAYGVVH